MSQKSKVVLFPWDSESSAHRQWLYRQRVECSWHQDMVETKWRQQQQNGKKCIYWIVPHPDHAELNKETALHPDLNTIGQLQDTATSINAVPRQPSQVSFIPIGHISLDSKNPEAESIDLDIPTDGVYWIKTFFVLHSLQGKGIGRAAMDEVENMAVREPLLAKTLMLDTVERSDQLREDFAKATFGDVPKFANQDWYTRRGYRALKIVQNYYDVVDRYGKNWDKKTIFMRKDIS